MAYSLIGFQDALFASRGLLWDLTAAAVRRWRVLNLRVVHLALRHRCIPRPVYQVRAPRPPS